MVVSTFRANATSVFRENATFLSSLAPVGFFAKKISFSVESPAVNTYKHLMLFLRADNLYSALNILLLSHWGNVLGSVTIPFS